MPPGNSLANIRVVVPVELDQVNLLALDNVLSESVEPLYSGIARYYFWWHILSKPVTVGVVQKVLLTLVMRNRIMGGG